MQNIERLIHNTGFQKILIFAPMIVCGLFILIFAVNMPLLDQWELVPMIQNVKEGNAQWNDFWLQHNEHRLLIPNLVLVSLALLTGWNLIIECVLSFLVAIASYFLLLKTIKKLAKGLKKEIPVLLPGILSIMWFSLVQVENWLWGWQFEWFLNVFAVVWLVHCIVKMKQEGVSYLRLIELICAAIVCQLTLGSGMLAWFIAVAGVLHLCASIRKIGIVVIAAVLMSALYYRDYISPSYPSKTLFLHEPLQFIQYICMYIGRPLAVNRLSAVLIGAILITCFICINLLLLSKKEKQLKYAFPVLLLGWYALGAACLTAISRVGFGVGQAYSSRYTTTALLLTVSVIIVGSLISFKHIRAQQATSPQAQKVIIIILVLVLGFNYAWGLRSGYSWRRELTKTRVCTNQVKPTDDCILRTYPFIDIFRTRLEYVKNKGIGGY